MDKYARDQLLFEDTSNFSRLYSGHHTHTFSPVSIFERYHSDEASAQKLIQISQNFSPLQSLGGIVHVLDRLVSIQSGAFTSIIICEPITRTLRMEIERRRASGEKWDSEALRTSFRSLLETLEATHHLNFCHGSLSDNSVFLMPSGEWKIGKFEQSHFEFTVSVLNTDALKPYLSEMTLAYLQNSSVAFDWEQADIYSLGVVFLAMASLGDIDFLWKMPPEKHGDVILQLDFRSAIIEVIAGMVTDALGERTTLMQAVCLLTQDKLNEEDRKKEGIVVERVGGERDARDDEKEEMYTCSFCSEKTGRLSANGYTCLNPHCTVNECCSGESEVAYCPMCSQVFNPAVPWSSPLVTEEQQKLVSLVCSYTCFEKLISIEDPKKCPYCSATPPKDCSWKARHSEVPEDQLLDICSFACYIVHGQMIGDEKEWGQACIQCGKITKQSNQQKIIQLECNPDHVFCCYKCLKVFAKGHGHTEVLCPICAVSFNFETVQKSVKNKKEGKKCSFCSALSPVIVLGCSHACCMQCVSAASNEVGFRKCPVSGCGHMEVVT